MRTYHVSELDVTSVLKRKREQDLRFVYFRFLSGNKRKIADDNVYQSDQSCPQALRLHLGTRKYFSLVFRECEVYLFWPVPECG
jgi:hypothetical protein